MSSCVTCAFTNDLLLFTCIQEQSPVKDTRSQAAHRSSPVLHDADHLRQLLIKKNEKIEFLKDHIDQLVEELHQKSRYVTMSYLMF